MCPPLTRLKLISRASGAERPQASSRARPALISCQPPARSRTFATLRAVSRGAAQQQRAGLRGVADQCARGRASRARRAAARRVRRKRRRRGGRRRGRARATAAGAARPGGSGARATTHQAAGAVAGGGRGGPRGAVEGWLALEGCGAVVEARRLGSGTGGRAAWASAGPCRSPGRRWGAVGVPGGQAAQAGAAEEAVVVVSSSWWRPPRTGRRAPRPQRRRGR